MKEAVIGLKASRTITVCGRGTRASYAGELCRRGGVHVPPDRFICSRLYDYFAEKPDVVAVILFGSVARGEAGPYSDVDVGVLFTREAAMKGINRSRLISDVMGVLERNDVDVVILNSAPPLLLHRVVRDGHVVYASDYAALAEFTIRAIQQYEDTKPLRELERRRLHQRLTSAGSQRGAAP